MYLAFVFVFFCFNSLCDIVYSAIFLVVQNKRQYENIHSNVLNQQTIVQADFITLWVQWIQMGETDKAALRSSKMANERINGV